MKRFALLAAMAALAAVIVLTVRFGSPYAPVVAPAPEDIEALWAIEDAREESAYPLVTKLACGGAPMAYNAQENTFYCTLGLENGETWPQLRLTAPDNPELKLVFADDYTYDWCSDAVRDGYAYQVMAYNDTHFAYFDIVFTGLPMVMIETTQEITTEDSPIRVTMSAFGQAPLKSWGRIHKRGASTINSPKGSYKIEFTRESDGRRKTSVDVPLFGTMDSLILNGMLHDDLFVRDKLSWALYESLRPGDKPFGARSTQYAEVYIDGQYHGLYLLMNAMTCADELSKDGARAVTDSVYRTAVTSLSKDREYRVHPVRIDTCYELYHRQSETRPFDALEPWMDLIKTTDDDAFVKKALAHVDSASMVEFCLFVQAAGMTDNVFNNMYIIAHPTERGVVYSFAPWDMDMTWARKPEEIGSNYENWVYFPVADRMIHLNAGGALRAQVGQVWTRMRETAFDEEHIRALLEGYAWELSESGAWVRNAQRWEKESYYPDFYEIEAFVHTRFALIDSAVAVIAGDAEAEIPFLRDTQYEGKGTPIVLE